MDEGTPPGRSQVGVKRARKIETNADQAQGRGPNGRPRARKGFVTERTSRLKSQYIVVALSWFEKQRLQQR